MRNSRVVSVVLPFVAAAALIGGTIAPPAAARTAHLCGATSTFAERLLAFEKTYDKNAATLNPPKRRQLKAFSTYFENAEKFFDAETQQWVRVGKVAPASVRGSFGSALIRLKQAAADFAAAEKELRSGDLTSMVRKDGDGAKAANGFADALPSLVKKCS